ncbi:MAG: hypothetical protein SGARI_005354 [Bacillariaceae sp.]
MEASIYQCPGCAIRTCSLQCCQGHKKRTGCSGKRNRGDFLPLCRMSDSSLRSDYFFLEEVLDQMPRARKVSKMEHPADSGGSKHNNKQQATNKKSRRLQQQAEKRGITLQILPSFMEQHKNNNSWYCGPRDLITWKVDCILVPDTEKISFKLLENEEGILEQILKRVPQQNDNATMEDASSDSEYKVFVKRPSPANQPRYKEVNPNESLRDALKGLTIVEHPTIYCVRNIKEHLQRFPTGSGLVVEQNDDAEE